MVLAAVVRGSNPLDAGRAGLSLRGDPAPYLEEMASTTYTPMF
jgi:hypothetical protein